MDLPGWTSESQDLYRRLYAELLPKGWREILTSVGRQRNQQLFTFNHPDVGSTFEYALFCNEEERKSITIMQFGPKTQGPEGLVHGGAVATAGDICGGIFLNVGMKVQCVTASFSVDYKRPVPIESTVIIEMQLDKVERRKHFCSGMIRSPDGSVVYDTISALFIQVSSEQN